MDSTESKESKHIDGSYATLTQYYRIRVHFKTDMELKSFRDLLTATGQDAINAAVALKPREVDFLQHFQRLCKIYPRETARGALETAILREKAEDKFPNADRMYFTREALEQASSYEVASHRAKRYRGYPQIIDAGCSIGSDTLTLSDVAPTTGVDLDPLRLAMAQANLRALGVIVDIIQCDLIRSFPCIRPSKSTAIFFDPARRVDGRRKFSVKHYIPPLSIVKKWSADFPSMGVKISPAVQLQEIVGYNAEVEFISLRGELKEAVLWFGELQRGKRQATILPGPHIMIDDGSQLEIKGKISKPQRFFYEPDPAVIRTGLIQQLMGVLDGAQVDPGIAYLTADKNITTPFARVWEVEDWFPFQLKRLRAYLRERHVGRVTVKKRGSPILPEDLIQALRLPKEGTAERVVFLTQLNGRPIIVICLG